MHNTAAIYDKFVDEYTSDDALRKYTTHTAGYGISYLLRHDYAQIYTDAIQKWLRRMPTQPLRLLEFGCGAGMNITRLVSLLKERNVTVDSAYGTDFSARLVDAAQHEARAFLTPELREKLSFHVARNEALLDDLAGQIHRSADQLRGYFDLIIGINTFRYCHRFGTQMHCAADLFSLLRAGGVCIMIDMNDRFPAFRSRLKDTQPDPVECYLPSLKEYTLPFQVAGFEVLKKGNFCWVPHSAGRALTYACRAMGPVLNVVARGRAMRSLVVARKPQ